MTAPALFSVDAQNLPTLVDRAGAALASARAAAEVLEDHAKHRLAEDHDAAQACGEAVGMRGGKRKSVGDANASGPATAAEFGLTRYELLEARLVRDAEAAEPGIVRRALDETLAHDTEPPGARGESRRGRPARPSLRGRPPRPLRTVPAGPDRRRARPSPRNRRGVPMTPTPDLARLRASPFALESLPTTILVSAQPARSGPVAKPLVEATRGELIYALAPAEEEFNAAADRLHALKKLLRLGREAGAVGTDWSVDVVARRS